ncbi:MAG: acyl--CoA ligase [Planctomycetes bacterium]|nr:acyl--CoA ligase [Planctomycetota bacterium]
MILLFDWVDRWARERPDAPALSLPGQRVTFSELAERSRRLAASFLACGVRECDRVAALLPPGEAAVETMLAAARVGASFVGLNPRHTREELRRVALDCAPSVLVCAREIGGRDYAADATALLADLPGAEGFVVGAPFGEEVEPFAQAVAQPLSNDDQARLAWSSDGVTLDHAAMIVYTSGSTGAPKGAVLAHRAILAGTAAQNARLGITGRTRALFQLPVCHVSGAVELAVAALVAGATLVPLERFAPEAALEIISRERVTFVGGVPTMFVQMLPHFARFDLSSVETFVFSGAPVPCAVVEALAATGKRCFTGWGMTETAGFVTYTEAETPVEALATTVGRADPAYEWRVVTPAGGAAAPGEVGELHVRGPCLFNGYWNDPAATAERLAPEGWLRTGDLARADAGGALTLVGRTQDIFKVGGATVAPREVEAAIETFPGVAQAAVIAVPDPVYGQVARAFVVAAPGASVDRGALAAHCRSRLAGYKMPRSFVALDALPLLANGKTDKRALAREADR